MNRFVTLTRDFWRSTAGSGKRPILLSVALASVGAIGVGGLWLVESRAEAAVALAEAQKAEKRQMRALHTLNEGDGARLMLQGDSAQERNLRIPMSAAGLERMSAVAGVPKSGPHYETALKCLTQAVYYEAANEPLRGKRAVAQVVLNRMRHGAYPNSVCGVVYEGANKRVCQFSFTCDGSLMRKPLALQWGQSRDVAAAALAGTTEPSVGTATHYHADYVLPRWAFKLGKIEKIGAHIFYRFNGYWGSSSAFTRRWAGREAIPALNQERLRRLAADFEIEEPQPEFVPGLTVVADVRDRHASHDVGGRIDTTKQWRLSIPDPVNSGSSYSATLESHEQHGLDAAAEGMSVEQQP